MTAKRETGHAAPSAADKALPDHVRRNRAAWQINAADYAEPAERAWAASEPYWGIWRLPDAELGLLPQDLTGKTCLEIGCGAGYVSAWMARRGAAAYGIDPTPNQLATAKRLRAEHNLPVHLVEGYGERLPFPDNTFDFAISEYGAALWADPFEWIPEAARVLRPGAQLVFMTNAAISVLCMPDLEVEGMKTELQRPYFGLHSITWPDEEAVEFYLPHGQWIHLLTTSDFTIERLLELGAPSDDKTRYSWADAEWAQSWPSEEAWVVRYNP